MNDVDWGSGEPQNTFEQTFPSYEFSELVQLGSSLAKWLVARNRSAARDQTNLSSQMIESLSEK